MSTSCITTHEQSVQFFYHVVLYSTMSQRSNETKLDYSTLFESFLTVCLRHAKMTRFSYGVVSKRVKAGMKFYISTYRSLQNTTVQYHGSCPVKRRLVVARVVAHRPKVQCHSTPQTNFVYPNRVQYCSWYCAMTTVPVGVRVKRDARTCDEISFL